MKQRCLICKRKRAVTSSGLLVPHLNVAKGFCVGSGQMPEIPTGTGKRIVHVDDPRSRGKGVG